MSARRFSEAAAPTLRAYRMSRSGDTGRGAGLERTANDPVAAARAEVEWPAALQRLQVAGLYVGVKVGRRTVA